MAGRQPRVVSSRRRVVVTGPGWAVHQFSVCDLTGAVLCRAAALRPRDSLLLWLGAGGAAAALGAVALALPQPEARAGLEAARAGPGAAKAGLGTALAGAGGGEDELAGGLARRLAAALCRPVYVCCSVTFDRFTWPLVEQALINEIKSRPECF